ncbi:hypothetical protein N9E09_00105 [bacterium]|jgi:hypothetical protein|nr:hypothetical protein [bacterium]
MSTTKVLGKLDEWKTGIIEDPDTGELIIHLPEHMLATLGWNENTELEWYEDSDGAIGLRKVKNSGKNI